MKTTTETVHGVLTCEVDAIEVTTNLPQADKAWTYTDQQGHQHRWSDGYPTLEREPVGPIECIDGEMFQPTRFVCAICREPIKPGTFVDAGRRYMPGRCHYSLNGEPISEDRYNKLLAERRAARPA